MGFVIDSSVFIALERRRQSLMALVEVLGQAPIALATVTASELLMGVHRANTVERQVQREAFVETVLENVSIFPFDLQVARVHARLGAELAAIGQPIGAHDLMIAATALAHGYSVLTDNLRHFQRIPGLIVTQPIW